jgi:NADH:ubiquinone oxidoreductase subunit F (NADH-binding)
MLDLKIDTEDREGETIMIGTGGVIMLDDTACMVDMARFLVGFFLEESCGKCVPCREGTKQMHRILSRICEGRAAESELSLLERLAKSVKTAAVCGMGSMAPAAALTTIEHFREEFETHVRRRECPAGVCKGSGNGSTLFSSPGVHAWEGQVSSR